MATIVMHVEVSKEFVAQDWITIIATHDRDSTSAYVHTGMTARAVAGRGYLGQGDSPENWAIAATE